MTRIDLASLQGINNDAVGWIEIPDTSVSYPLVHTTDNTYYLTHTFDNKTNRSGSIFVEASNAADFSDLHTIIYGHNMKNGSMFAGLKNYSDQSYAEAHPYIYVDLADLTAMRSSLHMKQTQPILPIRSVIGQMILTLRSWIL